jgi:hypothetical protein
MDGPARARMDLVGCRSAWVGVAVALAGCAFHVPALPDGDGADLGSAVGGNGGSDGNGGRGGFGGGGSGGGGGGGGDVADLSMPDLLPPPDLAPLHGELTVTRDGIPGTVDLSDEGKIDWAHFGRNNAADVNRKSGGPAEIALATVGAALKQFNTYTPMMRWSNGTPVANASTKGGVYLNGVDHAITLTVPADTTTHTLRAYLTHYQSTAQLVAHLSDGSAPDSAMTLTTGGANTYYRMTVVFRAASPGQTLTLTWSERADTGGGFGSVDLLGATVY